MATNNMYQERIQQNQKFLLRLLNLHIGHYYPLRKWLGISYKGKIDEITHLSFAYNTKYFKKGKKWFKQVTRTYQQPDLGYKLNLVLDKIPQLVLLPALLQPAFRLASVLLFSLTTTTYQPSTKDTHLDSAYSNLNCGTDTMIQVISDTTNGKRGLIHWNTTDIPNGATFSQGDVLLYCPHRSPATSDLVYINRLTQLAWTEAGATWNKYDGTNAWTTPGGDFTTTNRVSKKIDADAAWFTWNAATLIQDCYNNQSKNVHLLLNRKDTTYYVYFASREYATTSLRPKLTVTYTVPAPANFFPFF